MRAEILVFRCYSNPKIQKFRLREIAESRDAITSLASLGGRG